MKVFLLSFLKKIMIIQISKKDTAQVGCVHEKAIKTVNVFGSIQKNSKSVPNFRIFLKSKITIRISYKYK